MNCGNLPATFKVELERKVNKTRKPIIYFQHYTRDRFIDNTKDRWRSGRDIINKSDMLDQIANMSRLDYYINEKYDRLGYLDINQYFNVKYPNRLKKKMFKCMFNYVIDELFLKARQYENKILYNNVIDELNEQNRNKMNRIINKILTYQRSFHNVIEELNEKNRKKKNRKYYYKREWAKKGYVFNDFDAFYNKYITIKYCERCDDYLGSFCNTRGMNSRRVWCDDGINEIVCRECLDILEW